MEGGDTYADEQYDNYLCSCTDRTYCCDFCSGFDCGKF